MTHKSRSEKFIEEFGPDIIRNYRSEVLDKLPNVFVKYDIAASDTTGCVTLFVSIGSNENDTARLAVVSCPYFDVYDSDMIDMLEAHLFLSKAEAKSRLIKAGLIKDR